MPFREIAFKDELDLPGFLQGDEESALQSMLRNVSPIMKLWFGVMLLNLVLCLFIL